MTSQGPEVAVRKYVGVGVLASLVVVGGCSAADSNESPSTGNVFVAGYPFLSWRGLAEEYELSNRDVTIHAIEPDIGSSQLPTIEEALEGAEILPDVATFGHGSLENVVASGLFNEPVPISIDPGAICYRADLLAEAGIATTREEFAALLEANGGGWAQYFAIGRQYVAATGHRWFNEPGVIWQAMSGQVAEGYTVADRSAPVADDTELKERWDLLGAAINDGLSAGDALWHSDGNVAFADGSFATMPCTTGWRNVIESNIEARLEAGEPVDPMVWDVADTFPGGGWNQATEYLATSVEPHDRDATTAFAEWLLAPEQQVRMSESGLMPVNAIAQESWADSEPSEFFNGAPTGAIDVNRARQLPQHVRGPLDAELDIMAVPGILRRIDSGETSVEDGWHEFVEYVSCAREDRDCWTSSPVS